MSMRSPLAGKVLCARLDSLGDVLLAGPAVRAVAAIASSVTMLVGPEGHQAADLLPGVDDIEVFSAPWIGLNPPAISVPSINGFVDRIRSQRYDAALIFTSFHQSPLPLALLLRAASVSWIGAHCVDYPGSLLDLRLRPPGDIPEAERMMMLAVAAGATPDANGSRLAVDIEPGNREKLIVVHPGASVPARRPSFTQSVAIIGALRDRGWDVAVTGGRCEGAEPDSIARASGGRRILTPTLRDLGALLTRASVAVCPNTGPAHLAAAVSTPVVSLYSPVVSAVRWAPHGVPTIVLGDQHAVCRGSRARECPMPQQHCLDSIDPADVVRAVQELGGLP